MAVSARGADKLQAFADAHPGSLALPADVLDPAALKSALRTLIAKTGRVDLAVYCAGTYTPMRADAFDLARCGVRSGNAEQDQRQRQRGQNLQQDPDQVGQAIPGQQRIPGIAAAVGAFQQQGQQRQRQ